MNRSTPFAVFALTLFAAAAHASEASLTQPAASTASRAEVLAEMNQKGDAARYVGDAVEFARPSGFEKTRAQVLAETREAIRIGAMDHSERNTFITPEQLESIRQAGLKALPMTTAAAR